MALGLILLISPVAAFGEIADPKAGTIRAKLGPNIDAGVDVSAHGHVIINYTKGQTSFNVQVNVVKLSPETEYEVHLVGIDPTRQNLEPTFWTDRKRNGRLHVTVDSIIAPLVRVNIRLYGGTWRLTSDSDLAPGGSLRQSPSKRSK